MSNLKTKLAEIKALCDAAPLYPHKKWPVAFVQYPEVNEMLDFALNSRTLIPQLIKCVEILGAGYDKLTPLESAMHLKTGREIIDDARKQAEEILGGTE